MWLCVALLIIGHNKLYKRTTVENSTLEPKLTDMVHQLFEAISHEQEVTSVTSAD